MLVRLQHLNDIKCGRVLSYCSKWCTTAYTKKTYNNLLRHLMIRVRSLFHLHAVLVAIETMIKLLVGERR